MTSSTNATNIFSIPIVMDLKCCCAFEFPFSLCMMSMLMST